jgi:phosphoribosylformimino-5-aminoimidazole carboxamide ribotide isomerase
MSSSSSILIFPAIDLLGGKAVRLSQGKRETATVYSEEPWKVAEAFSRAGAARLHVVDLDAAFSAGREHNHATIKRIIAATTMDVEVGGGLRTAADCQRLFDLGAKYAVLGTAAIKTPALVEELCRTFPRKIIVAVDARAGMVATEGWQEDSTVSALDVGEAVARAGAAAVLYTDIGRDGMRTGPDLEATARLARRLTPCPVIASGGVARLSDLDEVKKSGAFAVIIGKAIYEKAFTVEEAIARALAPAGA